VIFLHYPIRNKPARDHERVSISTINWRGYCPDFSFILALTSLIISSSDSFLRSTTRYLTSKCRGDTDFFAENTKFQRYISPTRSSSISRRSTRRLGRTFIIFSGPGLSEMDNSHKDNPPYTPHNVNHLSYNTHLVMYLIGTKSR